MKTYEEALKSILQSAEPMRPERVNLQQAMNRILAEPVKTAHPLPPFTNSQMDGYAIRATDVELASRTAPVNMQVSHSLTAGDAAITPHTPGQATRIMTGAPMPEGADTVVPQEDVEIEGSYAIISSPAVKGQYVRFAGEDMPAGATVIEKGERIRAGMLGAAASTGAAKLIVAKKPRVGLIATGNELVEPGKGLLPGQIYNSNLFSLQAQVEEAGGEVIRRLTATDDFDSIRTAIEECRNCDVIITSGGVSVGDKDYLRPVIERLGEISFWQVAIRPGKPVAFGRIGATLVLSLPGNPASSFVTFEIFGRPLILKMQGAKTITRRSIPATLTDDIKHEPGRRSFVRVVLALSGSHVLATPTGPQGSGIVSSTAFAEGLLIVPENQSVTRSGTRAPVILLD
jgi:molybdopterin molybdotransferase